MAPKSSAMSFSDSSDGGYRLFDTPPTCRSSETCYTTSILPVSSAERPDLVKFVIPASNDLFVDPSSILLYTKCQIKPSKFGMEAAPCSPFFYLLWDKVDIELNGTPLTSSYRDVGYKAFFKILFSHSKCVKTNFLETVLWAPDSAEHADSIDLSANSKNEGLEFRHAISSGEKVFEMEGRLMHEFFSLKQYIVPRVEIKIRLYRKNPEFCLVSPDSDETFKVNLSDIKLNIRYVKPSENFLNSVEKKQAHRPAIYHMPHASDVKTRILTKDVKTITITNFFGTEKLPDKVVFALVPHQTYLGSLKTVPTVFKHHQLEEIRLTYQNQSLWYKMDFASGYYMDLYIALSSMFKDRHAACAPNIKFTDLPKVCCIYPFDLTPFKENVDKNSTGQSLVQLDLKFKDFVTESLQLLYYTEFPRTFTLNRNREVVQDI